MKYRRKMIAWLLAGTMTVLLAGCGESSGENGDSAAGGSSAAGESAESAETWTIGFANRLASDTFLKLLQDKFVGLCKEDGSFEVVLADANNDSQAQIDQVANFMVQEVDALVLCPNDGESLVPQIEEANKAGIPVFCFSQEASGGDFVMVGISNYDCGLQQGEWCYENLPENAKILYLGGNSGFQSSIDRKEGFLDGLGDRLSDNGGDLEILSYQECMYTMNEGMTITEDWIQTFETFDAIVAVNDLSALGAVQALKAANKLDEAAVIGIDGIDDAMKAVADGEMEMTVYQDPNLQAEALYNALAETRDGNMPTEDINVEVITVTAENVADYTS